MIAFVPSDCIVKATLRLLALGPSGSCDDWLWARCKVRVRVRVCLDSLGFAQVCSDLSLFVKLGLA